MSPSKSTTSEVYPGQSTADQYQRRYKGPQDLEDAGTKYKASDFLHLHGRDLEEEISRKEEQLQNLKEHGTARLNTSLPNAPERAKEMNHWTVAIANTIQTAELTEVKRELRETKQELHETYDRLDEAERIQFSETERRIKVESTMGDKVLALKQDYEFSKIDNQTAMSEEIDRIQKEWNARLDSLGEKQSADIANFHKVEMKTIRDQLGEAEKQYQLADNQRRQLENDLNTANSQLEDLKQSSAEDMKNLTARYSSDLGKVEKELETVREQKSALEVQSEAAKEAAENKCRDLDSQLTRLREDLEKEKKGRETSHAQMKSESVEHGKQLAAQADEHKLEKDTLNKKIRELQHELRQSKLQRVQDKEESEKWSSTWSGTFATSLARESGSAEVAKEEMRKLKEETDRQLKAVQKEREEARAKCEECENDLREQTDRADRAEVEVGEIGAKYNEVTQANAALDNENAKLKDVLDLRNKLIRRLNNDITSSSTEKDALSNAIAALHTKISGIQARVGRRDTTIKTLKQQKANVETDNDGLRSKVEQLEADKEDEKQEHIKAVNTLNEQLNELMQSEGAAGEKIAEYHKANQEYEKVRKQHVQLIKGLKADKERLKKSEGDLIEQLDTKTSELNTKTAELEDAGKTIDALKAKVAKKKAGIDRLEQASAETKRLVGEVLKLGEEVLPQLPDDSM